LQMVLEKKDEKLSPAAQKLRDTVTKLFLGRFKAILTDGEDLSLKIGVDPNKDDISIDVTFKAAAGSELAKEMQAAGKSQTLFGGLTSKKDAIAFNLTVNAPEEVKKSLAPAIEEAVKKGIEQEKDQVKQALAKKAAETLMPTLKSGELDAGVSLRGPDKDGHYTAVAGLKVKGGKGIDSFLRDVIKNVPEKDREKISLDAATVGDVKIHKITADDMGDEAKKVFGSNAVYLAFRDDAVLVALGADGLAAIKEAAKLTPSTAKSVVNIAVSVSRAAGL